MQRVLDNPITMYVPENCLPVAANRMLQFSSVLQRICTFDGHRFAIYKGTLEHLIPFKEDPPVNWLAIVDSVLHISPIWKEISSHLQSVTATWVDDHHGASVRVNTAHSWRCITWGWICHLWRWVSMGLGSCENILPHHFHSILLEHNLEQTTQIGRGAAKGKTVVSLQRVSNSETGIMCII